jgi:nucleotide-binding universal stress UspA family protein
MSRILFASNGSTTPDAVPLFAAEIADRLNAELECVIVAEPLPTVDLGLGMAYVRTLEEEQFVQRDLRAAIEAQLLRCDIERCVLTLRFGSTADGIAAAARESNALLIVIGLGSHNLIDRALGTETALHLVQVASTPILAVPAGVAELPRRVVVAVDFTATSLRAAEAAAKWLYAGNRIRLVHVWSGAERRGVRFSEEQRLAAQKRLSDAARLLFTQPDVLVETATLEGDVARTLLQFAAQTDSDMIALGSHGYGLWKRLTLGSVASKVLRLSALPVLVAPIGCLPTAVRPAAASSLKHRAEAGAT